MCELGASVPYRFRAGCLAAWLTGHTSLIIYDQVRPACWGPQGAAFGRLDGGGWEDACCCRFRQQGGRMRHTSWRKLRGCLVRCRLAFSLAALAVMAVLPAWAA